MEPAEAKVRYAVYGKIAAMRSNHHGWYVLFHGSHDAIFISHEQPDFTVGDTVKITFERISPDANAQRPPI